MAAYISAQTAAADGGDFTLADGASATLNLLGTLNDGTRCILQLKDSGGGYMSVPGGVLSKQEPIIQVFGPGTFRVVKPLSTSSYGVDKS